MSAAEPAVAVEGLRIVLRDTEIDIVDEVSFTIAPGEVLGLVGESGSGKTTVGLALLGHTRRGAAIAGGSIRVGDVDILSLSSAGAPLDPRPRRLVRAAGPRRLAQPGAAHRHAAARDARRARLRLELGRARCAHRRGHARGARCPTTAKYLRRYPHELSGGQQQRIGLAMAFACRPRLIVLDEPTTGLDVTTQAHVLGTVRELAAAHHVAALYVSHDLAVVGTLADAHGRHVRRADRRARPDRRAVRDRLASRTRAGSCRRSRTSRAAATSSASPGGRRRRAPGRAAARSRRAARSCSTPAAPRSRRCASSRPSLWVKCIRAEEVRASAVSRSGRLEEHVAQERVSDAVLSLDHVFAGYGAATVVHDINLQLAPHECLALVGESGLGQDDARPLDRRPAPRPLGADLAARAAARRRRAQPHARGAAVDPVRLPEPLRLAQPAQDDRADRAPAARRLRHRDRGRGRQARRARCSTASRSRRATSTAIPTSSPAASASASRSRARSSSSPSVLVCDEVTSALDVSVQAAIVELLAELQRELGLAMLFVTHNLPLVRSIAQRVAVMSAGRIVELGTVEHVLHVARGRLHAAPARRHAVARDRDRVTAAPAVTGTRRARLRGRARRRSSATSPSTARREARSRRWSTGELVADLRGGLADPATGRPWGERTSAVIFSGTKGIVATALLMLVERGALDLDAPRRRGLARVRGRAARAGSRVAQLLSHCGGLPGVAGPFAFDEPRAIARALAAQAPIVPVGDARATTRSPTAGWPAS